MTGPQDPAAAGRASFTSTRSTRCPAGSPATRRQFTLPHSAQPVMSPVNRQQPGLRLYRERDLFAAGDPAELLWIVHEEPVQGLGVGGKHWHKSSSVGWAGPGGRAVQDAARLPGDQG